MDETSRLEALTQSTTASRDAKENGIHFRLCSLYFIAERKLYFENVSSAVIQLRMLLKDVCKFI